MFTICFQLIFFQVCYSWEPCDSCLKYFPTRRIRDRHKNGFRKRGEVCTPATGDDPVLSNEPIDESFGGDAAAAEVLEGDEEEFDFEESSFAGPHFMAASGMTMADPEVIDLDDEDPEHHQDDDDESMLNPADILETSYEDKNTVTCTFCDLMLPRRQDYYEHANRDHLDQVSTLWHGCGTCVRYYPTRRALKNHKEKSHRKKASLTHEDASFKGEACTFCDLVFARKDQFYRHANDVHQDVVSQTWSSCPDCQRFFPTKRICSRHRERLKQRGESCIPKFVLPEPEPDPDPEPEAEVDPPSFLSVEYEEDDDEEELAEDADLQVEHTSGSNTGERSKVTCIFCNLVLSRRQDLYDHANRDHLDTVSQIWHGCPVCVRYYPTKRALNNHLEKSHRKVANILVEPKGETCSYCSMFFSRKELYYRHCNEDHVDLISQTWNPCVECFKLFPTKRVLSRHREKFRARGESCVPRYAISNGRNFKKIK